MKDFLIYAVVNIFTFIFLLASIFACILALFYILLLKQYSFKQLNKLLLQIFKGDVVYVSPYEIANRPISEWEQYRNKHYFRDNKEDES